MTFTYRRSSFALYGWLLVIVAIMAPMFLLPSSTNEAQAQSSTPAKPTGLTAQSVSHNSVTLAWDDPEDSSITGYQVLKRPLDLDEYGDGLGSAEFVAAVDDTGTSATTYTDTSVAARTRYVYRVKARNAQGLGGASNDADAETAEDPDSQRVQPCQEGYVAPTPTEVPVTAVPIVVESTTADYFVLYASHDVGGTTVEYPVRVVLGEDGTTTLSENVAPLPKDLYRVQKYSIEEPADVDGDCTDDITELGNLGPMNPVNAAPSIDLSDGVVALPDRETFEKLAYPDSGGTWHIKFVILDNDTDRPRVYFQNTRNALHHGLFLDSIGVDWRQEDAVSGIVILDPGLLAQDGSRGVYRFQSRRSYGGTYSFFERAYTLLAANVPFLADNLALWIRSEMLSSIQSDLPLYRSSRMNLVFDEDVYGDIDYMALNPGEGYGMLRSLDPDERPHSRDIVIYETLPNELPRVAGVMSTVPQTPLSHVNLRALQNGIPNAYIADALGDETISGLIDSHVYYAVIDTGYSIRAATQEEVDEHYASSRPAETQTPQRDLTVTSITPLSNIDFDDWDSFGVKAANVAVLRTLGFPEGTVPDGFAVPFYFYDEFMKHNNLYDYIEEMLADTDFQTDYDTKADKLKKLRKKIKKADTPDWIETALTEMHATFPEGTSLRYRSSTNNEDLPNFNGAGLYDSKTQRPEETEEDGISKSLKQVYASLWNFRAFVERDFHRIDHMAAAMGVLVHPNYSDEKVNGVAVSTDPAYGTKGTYYANSQVGEDLVTNPEAHTVPEEVLLNSDGTYSVVALSNKVSQGQLLMTDEQLGQLRQHLAQIHEKFDVLYGIEDGERFAIEIEFKIASDNILAIKQARPWVFTDPPPETGNKPHEVTGDALTAWLVTKPETHDGHPFIVHVRFSDSIDIVASDFRRRAAVVTGGRVTRVWRIDHRRDFWGIQATPDSHSSNATLALAPNRPCTIGGAICTFDGRRLSNRLEHTVATAVVVARPNIPATGTPSISGTAQVGETLTADTSAIADGNGLYATEFSYQWLADSVDIQGATGNTYILVAADVGKTITVLVSFTDDGGNEERLTSAATAAVAYVDGSPGAPREVKVQAGDTELLVSWQPPAEENKAPVAQYRILYREEGGSNQELHTSHLSQEIGNLTNGVTHSVQVTAKNAAGYGTPSDEVSETPDTLPPWAAKMLVVEYTSVSIGAASADLFSNAWGSAGLQVKSLWSHIPDRDLRLSFEDGVPDAADYTLKVGDLTLELPAGSSGQSSFRWTDVDVDWEDGQTISVRIVPTSATVTPQPNSPATGAPAISGTAQVGETLTADTSGIADANGLTNVTFNYQWIANDGNTDTDIDGATGSTYEVSDDDVGKAIRVRVTFNDGRDSQESLTSAATAEVTARPNSPATGAPTISGTAQVDETLTALTNSISDEDGLTNPTYSYQWIRSANVEIAGATNSTYTLSDEDVGKAIKVKVSFTDDADHEETLTSAATGVVAAKPNSPATGAPTIGGTPQVEQTLTADTSAIDDEDGLENAVFRYQWFASKSGVILALQGETSSTYTLAPTDEGYTFQVRVTFTDDADNEESLTSEATAPVAAKVPTAPLSLTVTAGSQTRELDVSWQAPSSNGGFAVTGYKVQWKESTDRWDTAAEVSEATETGTTHTITGLTGGVEYAVRVIASNDVGDGPASTEVKGTPAGGVSEQTVEPENSAPTGLPSISGTPQVDQTLTADTSNIDDEDGLTNVSYRYQWGAGGSDIEGATGSTYTLTYSEQGQTIQVQVSFTDDANNEETLTSQATVAVAAAPNREATGAPTISGTPQVGETLTAETSGIADEDGLNDAVFAYQWLADDANGDTDIVDATDPTYELSDDDIGQTIRVRVSFTDDGNTRESLTSAATGAVGDHINSLPAGAPVIIGTTEQGETLTADTSGITDIDGLTNAAFSYQWIRNGDTDGDTDIIDATDPTYELTSADLGRTIKVRVSFTDDAGNSESLTSAGTDEVGEAKLDPCSGGGYYPVPVDVAVAAVPIVVDSTTEEYFVLYVRPDLDSDREIPVSVTLGQNGTTTLTEQLSALPREHYRVEKYLIADPSDVDGDCIDDIGELQDPVRLNPLNPAPAIPSRNGAVAIPDHETFEALSYKGKSVSTDIHLTDLEYVKFYLLGRDTDRPSVYFVNTVRHRAHIDFGNAIELWEAPIWRPRWAMAGAIIYHPNVIAPDGSLGVYRYEFRPLNSYSFDSVAYSYEVLAASMPLLDNNLAYYPMPARASPLYREEKALYDDSRINVLFEEDILPDVDFIPLNLGEGYGFLRVMSLEERPNPRDIVIYETLPNELSRVAGIITTVPQTPLSHVNLRAVQDGVPNAFIRDALDDADIEDLVGGYVHYTVEESGYSIRAATRAEVDAHYAASSPSQAHSPERDLTVTQITALSDIEFEDWTAFGVKAANVAVLGALYFPEGTVPDGFAVPFSFYDEFMKHNEFYDDIEKMLADSDFQSDFDTQESELKKLRKRIKKGETPEWINTALTEMHAEFPAGTSLRYRSSTNNEDLPGFSGAGLYDSKTQHPEETEEDGISKSLKQVYASLWNFRAFTEREFHRIDHLAMAMGVLVHPNYSDELANGVAVSFDPVSGGDESYYVNTQVGEDLVTNPDAYSAPEEILLHQGGDYTVLATSNQVQRGQLLMSDAQMDQLRRHLEVIHDEFEVLYGVEADEPFAMEIEFKITSDDILSIKQARPWVFEAAPSENNPATGAPSIRGTAQVDQTLTADTSGIADADGLVNVSFSYQWIRNDGTTETDIENATSSTYTLSDTDVGETIKVRVSLTDDRGYEETLTSAATTAITGPNTPATGSPTISGTAQVDETLTAHVSGVTDADGLDNVSYTYQWIANDGTTDTDIENATAATYTPVMDDQGKTIKVRVSFTDDANNSETLSSEATATVATASQWRADMSVVDYGTGAIGAASADLFSNVGGNAGLQAKWLWYYSPERKLRLAFTERVPGTEELTLQVGDVALALQPGDATYSWEDVDIDWEDGQTLTARIVRARANAVVAPNSPATGAPTINGTAQVGETLTADTSGIVDADGLTNVSYSYQWIRNDGTTDTDIQGATSSTYTLVSADEGKTIKVRVSFTDDAGHSETLTSGTTNAVAARGNSPATGLATISGTAQVGEVLTADTPGIVDADGLTSVSYSYQWIRNDGNTDADIGGQTASTYTLVTTDQGKTIKVKVSFTDDQGNEETLTSAATAEVAAKPNSAPTGLPTINGTAQVGETLSADTSAIADEDGLTNVSYSYQWIRNDGETDTDVEGATDATYQLSGGEVGETIKVRVSFTDDADHEETLTSAATGVVAAKPNSPATGAPTIDGTAQVGETLTVLTNGITDADGLTNVSYSYQWLADNVEIAGATNSTYTLTDEDVGKGIKVRVSFTDDADNQESLTSEATDTVAATKPGVPGHLNVSPHDAGALDVYWEAPASDGGSAITGYKVQWKESADSWDTPADVSEATASGTIHTITGLTDGVEYSVRVLATNGVGDSPPSVEQTGTPRETRAPEMVRPRVDGATLKVLYDEALDEGSAPPADSFDVRVACTCDDTTWLDEEAKRAVESVSVDGDTVVLTLVSAATSEDVVVVSYTPPSDAATARTRDLAGNAAAGFKATEVFNDTDETAESEKSGEPEETTEGETPLTVGLEAATESHNGTDAFTFEIRFSEELPLSYKTLRDLAFTVSGGEVLKAQRLDKPSNIRWLITVEPDSNGDVAVVLPETTDCDADGAVCTADGRKLSKRLEFTVSGPGR